MADDSTTTIPLSLPKPEATALAALAGRFGIADAVRLAAPCASYGERPEADVMVQAMMRLRGALAGAGFVSR
jgi:hypothetical protein